MTGQVHLSVECNRFTVTVSGPHLLSERLHQFVQYWFRCRFCISTSVSHLVCVLWVWSPSLPCLIPHLKVPLLVLMDSAPSGMYNSWLFPLLVMFYVCPPAVVVSLYKDVLQNIWCDLLSVFMIWTQYFQISTVQKGFFWKIKVD